MPLADALARTALKVLNQYGNTVELKTTTNDGVYNPQTGSYGTPTVVTKSKKAYIKTMTTKDYQNSPLPEGTWGSVNFVATITYDSDVEALDNKWTIDGHPVVKVDVLSAQDTRIVAKVYCG